MQRKRRDAFNDAAWAEIFTKPRITEGTVNLIIGDSVFRVLTRIQAHWQVRVLSFSGAAMPQMLASREMLDIEKTNTVTSMMGTNDISRGESRKMMRFHEKVNCIPENLLGLTICTVPYNMMQVQNAMSMNERVRHINDLIRGIQKKSILPVKLLDVARMMEGFLLHGSSWDNIHFDKPKGVEWLNGVFQKHINDLKSDLLESGQLTFCPPPNALLLLGKASGRPIVSKD